MLNYKKRVLDKINNFAILNYKQIHYNSGHMIMGEGIFNNRCQLNAVQSVKEGKSDKVILCICIDDNSNDPSIHFINMKDNKYIDNTLGYFYRNYTYYIIREVESNEYKDINKLLTKTKELYVNMFTNKFTRWLFNINAQKLI